MLREAIRQGYRVKAVVRNANQIPQLDSHANVQYELVKNLQDPSAYEGLLHDVEYIIHIASPLPHESKDFHKTLIEPAVENVKTILKAAQKAPSVKRFVYSSSVAALSNDLGNERLNTDSWRKVDTEKTSWSDVMSAYFDSKAISDQLVWEWRRTRDCKFDIVAIYPATVFGPVLSQEKGRPLDPHSTPGWLWSSIHRDLTPPFSKFPATAVHIDDVSFGHVAALRMEKVEGDQRIIQAQPSTWEAYLSVAKKHFPDGPWKAAPIIETIVDDVDGSSYEKAFGRPYTSLEDAVVQVIEAQQALGMC